MKFQLLMLTLIASFSSFAQNAMKFHHKLSQEKINNAGFELRTNNSANQLMTIGGTEKLKCVIATDGKGTITVDFWSILNTTKHKDIYAGSATIVNSATTTTKFILSDNRISLGMPLRVLNVPFNAWTFSIGTTPMRFRSSTDSS